MATMLMFIYSHSGLYTAIMAQWRTTFEPAQVPHVSDGVPWHQWITKMSVWGTIFVPWTMSL
jgi:hypothetical protein